jgi:spermidine synthase
LFVALLAPVVFERLLELQLGLIACCVCVMLAHRRHRSGVLSSDRTMWLWCGLLVACIGLFRMMNTTEASQTEVAVSRNFYGVLRVLEERTAEPRQHFRTLVHGRTEHGRQFLAADRRRQPTTYYGETSGVGLALQNLSRSRGIRGGFVGMGVGTLATYGKPNDVFRFYEIDPDIVRLAETEFTFLRDSDARIEIVLGDARLSLEREAPQNFDLLVLDAFSSDAIPVHLLTREAMTIYRRHLRNDGVLAIHISNRFFDLRPIVTRLAEEFGFRSAVVESVSNPELSQFVAHWMLLSKNDEFWARPALQQVLRFEPTKKEPTVSVPLWTDQFSNLLSILK